MTTPKPSWSILDRSKPWTPAVATDIRATFAKARRDQALAAETAKAQAWRGPGK